MLKHIPRLFCSKSSIVQILNSQLQSSPPEPLPVLYDRFAIHDENDSNMVRLVKGQIEVTFSPQSFERDDEDGNSVEFRISVNKSFNRALLFDCSVFDSELFITQILYTEDADEDKETFKFKKSNYMGPKYLNQRLQEVIMDYLDLLGINEDLVQFIENYSTLKCDALYRKWSQEVIRLLED